MKVLVIGATGFIGFPVVQAFARAGHTVNGLARTTEKARTLAAEEIIPIIGDASNPNPWISIVAELDTVIDIVATSDLKGMGASLLAAISEAAQKYRPHGAPKL